VSRLHRLRAAGRRHPDLALTVAAGALVLTAALGVVGVRVATPPQGRVPPGTSIGGVPVGGLSPEQAESVVRANLTRRAEVLTLHAPGYPTFPLRVPVAELSPEPRVRLALRRALPQRNLGGRVLREIGLGDERRVPLQYRIDGRALERLVVDVARRIDRPPRSAALRVSGGRLVTLRAQEGRRVRRAELLRRLRRLPTALRVPIAELPPAVSDEAAQAARRRAAVLTRRGVLVEADGRSLRLDGRVLLQALSARPVGRELRLKLAAAPLRARLEPRFGELARPARSATFRISGRRVTVIPGREGRRIDVEALARAIARRPTAGRFPLPVVPVAPALTTGEAQRFRIREPVASFTTRYPCCQPRVTNIRRAARILDGTVIAPGERFSLNEALGERTAARGFVPAPQINAGRLEEAVGGGVSQIATTVFNAGFFAGLRIVTHTPHEFWISRYPPGREATISWGGPELIFENDWPAGVLVAARATATSVTVTLYSSRLGRRVTSSTVGEAVEGAPFTVTYTRRILRRGALLRAERFTWSYRAAPAQ
jgi:vancomycin resistance protein YoaR